MATDKSNPLAGCTFEGRPVAELCETEKAKEVAAVVKEELAARRKQLPPPVPLESIIDPRCLCRKTYVRHSRTNHLTDQQIRKEYGVMSRPHKSMTANVLDTIRLSPHPLSNRDIADVTGYTAAQVQSITSFVFCALGDVHGINAAVDTKSNAKLYSINLTAWPEFAVLMQAVNAAYRQRKKPYSDRRRKAAPKESAAVFGDICENHYNSKDITLQKLAEMIGKLAADGVEVKFSGGIKVEVIFSHVNA
jgi:hypothetical protein